MTHSRSASDQGSLVLPVTAGGPHQIEKQPELLTEDELISGLVSLFMDITALSGEKSFVVNELVIPSLPSSAQDHLHLLNSSLDEGFAALNQLGDPLANRIVDIITARFESWATISLHF